MRWNLKIRKINKKTWKLSSRVRRGKQRKTKCSQKYQKGSQREPTGAKKDPKGARREPKGSQREPKGSQRETKASQREPKASQRITKMPKQIYARKKILKKGVPHLFFGWFLTHFDELKTLKSIEKQTLFLLFHDFWTFFKNIEKRGGCALDFWIHFQFPGLPKPPLFARLLSQGYLQIHLPNEITWRKGDVR